MNKPEVEPTFELHQTVVHSEGGVGTVQDVVTMTIEGKEAKYYHVTCERMEGFVPTAGTSKKLRPLASSDDWAEVKSTVRGKPELSLNKSHKLNEWYSQQLREGTLHALCVVLRDTAQRKNENPISETKRNIFNVVWTRLVDEYAATFGFTQSQAEVELRKMCPSEFVVPDSAYGSWSTGVSVSVHQPKTKSGEPARETKRKPKKQLARSSGQGSSSPLPKKPKQTLPPANGKASQGERNQKVTGSESEKVADQVPRSSPDQSAVGTNRLKLENAALQMQIDQLEAQLRQQKNDAQFQERRLVQERDSALGRITQLNQQIEQLEQALEEQKLRSQTSDSADSESLVRARRHMRKINEDLDKAKKKNIELNREINNLKKQIADLEAGQ